MSAVRGSTRTWLTTIRAASGAGRATGHTMGNDLGSDWDDTVRFLKFGDRHGTV
jgi:hypothetical protein